MLIYFLSTITNEMIGSIVNRLMLSFLVGVYVGTYYDCKPYIEKTKAFLMEHIPNER